MVNFEGSEGAILCEIAITPLVPILIDRKPYNSVSCAILCWKPNCLPALNKRKKYPFPKTNILENDLRWKSGILTLLFETDCTPPHNIAISPSSASCFPPPLCDRRFSSLSLLRARVHFPNDFASSCGHPIIPTKLKIFWQRDNRRALRYLIKSRYLFFERTGRGDSEEKDDRT